MTEFEGIVALVTGGASGIGAATAELLHERGASVAILDRDLAGATQPYLALEADITDDRAVRDSVARVVEEFGSLDVVVNNAGMGVVGTIVASDEEWLKVLDVNVVGAARVCRAALPHLLRSSHASIVNVASVLAVLGVPNRVVYSASKGAVMAMTLAMAADLVGHGVRVNCVAPGTTDTPWIGRLLSASADPVADRAALEARQPLGRLVSAPEVAHAVAYLASPGSGSTTGTVLFVDGGMTSLRVPR